jgi:aminoglycoside phosphotransferase (APT) family kinase protein
LRVLLARPWTLPAVARTFAEAHAAMHARHVPELPELRGMLERRIRAATPLPPPHRDAALRALDTLSDGDALCHGDYHPDNVLLSAHCPVVIDWENAAHGDPLFDVARSLLLLDTSHINASSPAGRVVARAFAWAFRTAYMRHYRRLHPFESARLAAWTLPVATARLSEGIEQEEAFLLARVRRLVEPLGRREYHAQQI